jgi:uncharacterized protein YegP (UPF0339 family)
MSHPRFKTFSNPGKGGDQYAFNLTASNGAIDLSSERYASHSGAVQAIESVRTNAAREERYERRTSRADEPYFVLKAANGEIVGTSEMYSSAAARDEGIRAVMKNAMVAIVEG